MYLETVTETEIEKIVVSLKNGAPGYDEITTDCIKSTIKDLSAPLAFLINLSFRDGLFPDEMKTAKVVPLYKANDPTVFSNYRPVSILPVFSKILERVMYNRLIKFLKKYDILYRYQFGFRDNHSTYMAMMILLDNITKALDRLSKDI